MKHNKMMDGMKSLRQNKEEEGIEEHLSKMS